MRPRKARRSLEINTRRYLHPTTNRILHSTLHKYCYACHLYICCSTHIDSSKIYTFDCSLFFNPVPSRGSPKNFYSTSTSIFPIPIPAGSTKSVCFAESSQNSSPNQGFCDEKFCSTLKLELFDSFPVPTPA